ncbi:MAG TPA: DEAD/DEAH box helicase [Gemmatimonadaceae bacterium]|nr:DEAD/DEAH box helicase [Gemmatimonadaceae bacterium]
MSASPSFAAMQLDRDLLRGLKELGFLHPTPIQLDAIPPALEGRDVLACAVTGSGKTAAFLLPILQKLIGRPRRATRALVITPTRELAAQIVEHFDALAVHTPVTSAAVFGGVGMGPQEHAFRSGVDVIVATPGRLLDHLKSPYAILDKLEFLVLDEADRMLDMGFLPEIRKILRHLPAKRQTMFFSATMPAPIVSLTREMLRNPVSINIERASAPAVGITQAVYPVPQELKAALLLELLRRGEMEEALVFTRTKHRANRLFEYLARKGISVERIHGNRSQPQRTAALYGFKAGTFRVLVATDIAARGIDVVELGHVVNFDVPPAPEDYIHRVGRTARAEAIGDAFTFVAPEEEAELRDIERVIGRRLPRVLLPDFDYKAATSDRLEIPIKDRIAAIRARKAEERARAAAKAARRAASDGGRPQDAGRLQREADRPQRAPGAPSRESGSSARSGGPGRRPRRPGRGRREG